MSDTSIGDVNAGNFNAGEQHYHAPVTIQYFGASARRVEVAPPPSNKLFLSYARKDDPDGALMRRLHADLTTAGFDVRRAFPDGMFFLELGEKAEPYTRQQLEGLLKQLADALAQLPADKRDDVEFVKVVAQEAVDEAGKEKPNKRLLEIKGENLN